MNNSSRNYDNILIALLCISLILNIFNYRQIQSLKDDLNILNNNHSRIEQSVNHSIAVMNSTADSLKEKQSWITPVSLNVGNDSADYRMIQLSWAIREYPEGTPVMFYYRYGQEKDFTALHATSTGGGSFVAELQIPKTYDPDLRVFSGDDSDLRVQRVAEEGYPSGSSLEYYITMQKDQFITTSDKDIINVSKISQVAAPINVNMNKNGIEYRFTMLEESTVKPEVTIRSAELIVYQSGKITTTIPFNALKNIPNQEEIWNSPVLEAIWKIDNENKAYPEFEIKMIYTNGTEIRRKI